MKKILALLVIMTMLLVTAFSASAAGNLYFEGAVSAESKTELSSNMPLFDGKTSEESSTNFTNYTFGVLYPIDLLILNAEFAFGEDDNGVDQKMWTTRVGYIVAGNEKWYIFPVVSILNLSESNDSEFQGTMVGLDGLVKLTDRFNLYGSYGISLAASAELKGTDYSFDGKRLTAILLKANYDLTEQFSLALTYRGMKIKGEDGKIPEVGASMNVGMDMNIFTLGATYHF